MNKKNMTCTSGCCPWTLDSEHTRFSDFTPSLHPPFCFSYERHVCIVVNNGFSTVETCNAEDVMVNLKLPEGT